MSSSFPHQHHRHPRHSASLGSRTCNALRPACGRRATVFQEGFSLVEVMVVLVIIGLLAGLVTINVRGHLVRAKQNAARAEIATICEALESFYALHDRYPTNEEGLLALTERSDRMTEPLLNTVPMDPWRRPYQYNQPGREGAYEVISLGADGREGGEPGSVESDIVSWDLKEGSVGDS